MSRNLIARLAVALVFIPVILWISYEGGWWLYGLVMFLAAMAMSEFLVAEGYKLSRPAFWLVLAFVLLLVDASTKSVSDWLMLQVAFDTRYGNKLIASGDYRYWQYRLIVPFLLVVSMLFAIGKAAPAKLFNKMTSLTCGVLYVGLLYPFVVWLGGFTAKGPLERIYPTDIGRSILDVTKYFDGGDALLFLFGLLWIGDTAAMYVGKTFGKHKLAPSVSPNKTVEGFIGGLVAAVIVGIVMAYWKFTEFPMYQILMVAVLCSLFGQLGDLVESMWKRSLNLKDSSAIIPGHGGFLDRFDSLLFAAPVMYYFFVIFR